MGLWIGGLSNQGQQGGGGPNPADLGTKQRIRDLEHQVQRLSLLNQALWELLSDHTGLTDDQLEARIKEVDLRDGVEDGRMTDTALQCPKCNRVSSSKHWKCLYCGAKFKRPIMG